jgi:hypothetical protein
MFTTRFHYLPFRAVAASYDSTTKTTYALRHCEASPDFRSIERLKQYLSSLAPLEMHPMMLPVVIIDMATSLALGTFANTGSSLPVIEAETGQNGLHIHSTNNLKPLDDPLKLNFLSNIQ